MNPRAALLVYVLTLLTGAGMLVAALIGATT